MIEPENILIVRTDRIGDVILTLPLASIIKKHFPNCRITFLVREYTRSLIENHPFIDEIILLNFKDGKPDVKDNASLLRKKNFDTSIIVYPTFKIAFILFRAGIKMRIGTGYRWYSFLFNKRVYEHRKDAKKHELEYNVNLLKTIGINEQLEIGNVDFSIRIDEKSIRFVDNLFEEIGCKNNLPIVLIHPGSGGSAVDWPISNYRELLKKTARELSCNLIVTGSKDEKKICRQLSDIPGVVDLSGELSLSGLTALIDKSNVIVTNSTGPIHIAAALGKYTIGFFPKITECLPRRWGPYTERRVIFTPEIDCNNCSRKQCEELNCMKTIEPDRVFESLKNVLTNLGNK